MITDNLLYNSLSPVVYFIIDFMLYYLWMLSTLFYSEFVAQDNEVELSQVTQYLMDEDIKGMKGQGSKGIRQLPIN